MKATTIATAKKRMKIFQNILSSYFVFAGITATAWFIGFLLLVPLMRIEALYGAVKKAITIVIVLALVVAALALYFYWLNRILDVPFWPFIFYSLTPIATTFVVIYFIIQDITLSW